MPKSVHDDVIDSALNYVADNGDKLVVCSQEPTDFTQANVTYALADVTLTVGDGNGSYTVADASGGGRELAVAENTGVNVDTTGTATHVAIVDTANSKLLLVTTCTSQSITSGNTITVPEFKETIGDPV